VQSVPGLHGVAGERMLMAVGVAEVAIAVWMLSRRAPVWCAAVQTVLLVSMNLVELTYARPLLLWPAGLLPVDLLFLSLVWAWALKKGTVPFNLSGNGKIKGDCPLFLGVRARLRRHPLPIRATLRDCLTLTYAVPARILRPLLPPGLALETVGDEGFVAVALVQTERLRPDGMPSALGGNFFLAGYRVFARFRTEDGRTLRGLRILRSDTDRTLMALGGNLLTHYNYHRCRASVVTAGDAARFTIHTADHAGDLDVIVDPRRVPRQAAPHAQAD